MVVDSPHPLVHDTGIKLGRWPLSSHLGSEMSAECRTRPQYVLRSYCDAGNSRLPGSEEVMRACGDAAEAIEVFSAQAWIC